MEEPTPNQIRLEFLLYRKSCHETLGQFLANYHKRWLEANRFGIEGMEAIVHLIPLLPSEWQDWAISLIPSYIDRSLLGSFYGDFRGFIATLSRRYFVDEAPPPIPAPTPPNLPHNFEENNNDGADSDPTLQVHVGDEGEALQNLDNGEVANGPVREQGAESNGEIRFMGEGERRAGAMLGNGYVGNEENEGAEPSDETEPSEASSTGANV